MVVAIIALALIAAHLVVFLWAARKLNEQPTKVCDPAAPNVCAP